MKKFAVLTAAIALMGLSVAQAATKIGVVDIQKIIQKSPEVAAINKQLNTKFEPVQQKIMKADKLLRANLEKYNRNSSVMSAKERDSLSTTITRERQSLIHQQQDYRDNLSLAQHEALHGLFTKVQNAIDNIAKQGNYDIILQRASAPYASKAIDITDQVIKTVG